MPRLGHAGVAHAVPMTQSDADGSFAFHLATVPMAIIPTLTEQRTGLRGAPTLTRHTPILHMNVGLVAVHEHSPD